MITIDVWAVLETLAVWVFAVMVVLGLAKMSRRSSRWRGGAGWVVFLLAIFGVVWMVRLWVP